MSTITHLIELLGTILQDLVQFGLDHPGPIGGGLLVAFVALALAWRSGKL